MDILIFGKYKAPDISFRQDPEKGLIITCKNNYVTDYAGLEKITWHSLACGTRPLLVRKELFLKLISPKYNFQESKRELFSNLINTLCSLTQTKAERLFLEKYAEYVKDQDIDKVLHSAAALIPQLWINWLHYSPEDKERARKIRRQPFRVDFAVFEKETWSVPFPTIHRYRKIVTEIDGPSHFGEMAAIDSKGVIQLEASMDKYTEHLRKDRWLRKQGWEVFRFTDKEVDEEDFKYFLDEMDLYGVPGYVPF